MLMSLTVDGDPGSSMTLDLSANPGFDVLTTGTTVAGLFGLGEIVQSGGTHDAGQLVLGQNAGSTGTYLLNGGTLNDSAIIGDAGTGYLQGMNYRLNGAGCLIAIGNFGAYRQGTISQPATLALPGVGAACLWAARRHRRQVTA